MSSTQTTLKQDKKCYTRFSVRLRYQKCMKSVKQTELTGLAKQTTVSRPFYFRNSLQEQWMQFMYSCVLRVYCRL